MRVAIVVMVALAMAGSVYAMEPLKPLNPMVYDERAPAPTQDDVLIYDFPTREKKVEKVTPPPPPKKIKEVFDRVDGRQTVYYTDGTMEIRKRPYREPVVGLETAAKQQMQTSKGKDRSALGMFFKIFGGLFGLMFALWALMEI